jgi:hypothetical protein
MPSAKPASTVKGIPVLKYSSTTTNGPYNLAWEGIQVPTNTGASGTVWSSAYASSNNTTIVAGWNSIAKLLGATTNTKQILVSTGSTTTPAVSWSSIGSILNATANDLNKGKFLIAGSTGSVSWSSIA